MARRKKRIKSRHLKFAASDEHGRLMVPIDGLGPVEAFDLTMDQFASLGAKILKSPRRRPAVMVGRLAFFPERFWATEPVRKLAWARHELVHVLQWATLGRVRFAFRWLTPAGQWALEIQAERARMQAFAAMDKPEAWLREAARKAAHGSFGPKGGYPRFRRLEPRQLRKETERILLDSVGLK